MPKNKNDNQNLSNINNTYQNIKTIIDEARSNAYHSVNFIMVEAYWNIGRIIVEEEQKGEERAEYGKGFDESNLRNIRKFYLTYPKCDALRHELSWTHYRLLMRVDKEDARNFYMYETINNNWSTRELERQINSLLFDRIALSIIS